MTRRRMAMLAALMASSIAASSNTLTEAQSGETGDENMNNLESPQQENESVDQTVINNNAGEPGSRERDVSETTDDERIRGSSGHATNEKPRVKRDPRPVSEQVKAYYENISRGSDESEKESGNIDGSSSPETEEEHSDASAEADLEGIGNKSSGENTYSADTPSIKTAVEGEANHVDVNDKTENRNPAHHNTDDAVYSDAPNESTNRQSEAITGKHRADTNQETFSVGRLDDRTAQEEVKVGEPGEKLTARDNPNAADPPTGKVLDAMSSIDDNIEDYGSSSSESTSITDPPSESDNEAAAGTKRSQVNEDDMDRTDQEPISDDTSGDPTSSIIDDKDARRKNETIPIDSPEPSVEGDTVEAADEPIDRSSERVTDKMTPADKQTLHERDSFDNETAAQTAGGSPKDATADNESASNSTVPASDETVAEPTSKSGRDNMNTDEEVIDFDVMDGTIEESPEDEASKETIGNQTSSNNAPSNNKMSPKKPKMEDYVGEDVIDFDIIDKLSSGSGSGQVVDAESDYKGPDEPTNYSHKTKNNGTKQNTSEESAPKKGSVAEFFDKVSQKEAVDFGSTAYIRPAKSATVPENVKDTKVTQKDPPVSSMHEKRPSSSEEQSADTPHEYSGGWGVRAETAPSALPEYLTKSLYIMTEEEVGRDQTQRKSDSIYQEVLNSVGISGAASQDSAENTRQVSASSDDTTDDGDGSVSAESKSVNFEFVDGLDDIDKFFQSVDPPDELDVGAAGSSIQEVLVGQSVKIVLNRVKLGFRFVRKRLGKVKARLDKYVSRRTTQDGEVALITREDIKATVDNLKRLGKQTLRTVKNLVDDLFADEEEGDVYDIDNGLDQVRTKIDSLRREQQRIQVPQRQNANN